MNRELCLRNRQRVRRINRRQLRKVIATTLHEEFGLVAYQLGVHLVAAPEMTRVNERYLRHAGSTDVITFDHRPGASSVDQESPLACENQSPIMLHGEVFVCVEEAVAQARRFRTTWQAEVLRYILHGLLHLRGYDDTRPAARRAMKRAENRLLRRVARRFALSNL
ncbi:MAG: rRNA maturation RNase YbeY [Verrucomicrobiae bacterium]|nr:rRNA maturation RNase YbeY [Verrucomicrobiae bacterium]